TDPSTGEKRTVTEQIAIKTFKTGKLDDAATEIRAHQSAMGPTGHENIVGMKGVVRCPDGSVMMAMEVAKTDADQMIQKLDQAVANGTLSPLAANAIRLTVMKDMLQGLQHFQETRGMTHADVKDPNYLIGTDGRAKLADFGTATTGDARWYGEALVANPRWKAPEILAQDEQRRVDKSGIVTKKKAELEEAMNALDELGLPKAERTEAGKELKKGIDVTAKARVEALPDNVVTPKADTWSAGITAYRLFHGEYPFEADFNSEIEELITEYAKNPDGTLIEMGRDATGNSTGKPVTALDRVLNDMLQVDPAKRPSVTDVLRNPIFDEPFVGSEDAYALIKALSEENPDPAKLKALSDKLGD
ncbi:MAG: protein kinase, partial [Verrucomicrobium sp.]